MHTDPFKEFENWFAEAQEAEKKKQIYLGEAFNLATVNAQGRPSSRQLLYKGIDRSQALPALLFYSNYESRKAQELVQNPWAAMCFHWSILEKQIRIEGQVEKASTQVSDAYWQSRPRESQVSAAASPQSQILESENFLEGEVKRIERQFAGQTVPRPENWGGYRLLPLKWEFWHGMPHRRHERTLYELVSGNWSQSRLAP